ncbi:MAG: ribokinase [Lacisediminihabitans sp.]
MNSPPSSPAGRHATAPVAKAGVAIVGSANMDLVFSAERIPQPGETLLARSADRIPGGKGLNQAVAAARAGAPTTFVGALGSDENGDALAETMAQAGIVSHLVRRGDEATGQAFIVVSPTGENTIIVASGANARVTALTSEDRAALAASSVLLMQLELPMSVVLEAAAVAREAGTIVMLNAAPARTLSKELLDHLDYLIVNEHEACLIGGSAELDTASLALAALVGRVIVTVGADGAVLYDGGAEFARVSPPRVTLVDTTGAGDTFCGAFAAAVAEGEGFEDAAAFATVAAALSVQTFGAVPSIPERSNIDAVISGNG